MSEGLEELDKESLELFSRVYNCFELFGVEVFPIYSKLLFVKKQQ